jgi:colanic acid/amylovoran biosynthesis glycosyltransferase
MNGWIKVQCLFNPSQWSEDGDCEGGAPVILLDAQARGLPVIATQHADIPFVVQHDVSGFLVPERDVNALKDAIIRFSQLAPPERETLGAGGCN